MHLRKQILGYVKVAVDRGLKIPFGVRSVGGTLLIGLGMLGFLPILGFWMIPVGAVLIALDVPAARKRLIGWVRAHR